MHVQNFSQFVPLIRDALPNAKIILHTHAEWLAQLDRDWVAPGLAATDSAIFCSNFYAEQTPRLAGIRDALPRDLQRRHARGI